jgi:hypothetical protein
MIQLCLRIGGLKMADFHVIIKEVKLSGVLF